MVAHLSWGRVGSLAAGYDRFGDRSNAIMIRLMDNRLTVGTVKDWKVRDDELVLAIVLSQPIESEGFVDREPWVTVTGGEFSTGSPLGAKIEPRFEGRQEIGATVEISVLDPKVPWTPGVLEANGPRFFGQVLTLRSE